MKILAIETSCDETAIAILECDGSEQHAKFTVLGNALISQIELHKQYGGVFPSLAKREHAKNLVPILEVALEEAKLLHKDRQMISEETRAKISEILARESGLAEAFFEFISECKAPEIDTIAVTAGPGLEPALWVGISFAKTLALVWNKPLIAVNHMEGHILAALAQETQGDTLKIQEVTLPLLALLISGGHTELVLMKKWLEYEFIGETRDDAVGEAFDKVARMLGLPYPGGPEISRLAEEIRSLGFVKPSSDDGFTKPLTFTLPRPMIREDNCDFSFAGLKTAVLYLLKKMPNVSEDDKKHIAYEFENAVADVLWHKTSRALEETCAKTLVIGGGVSANTHIQRVFKEKIQNEYPEVALRIPEFALSTDNAVMIALAGYYCALRAEYSIDFKANGNLHLI
ncbi:MAG: tRNA (adenosine(37)-N6)-threonylcarbamoyltransferase complex transferase subunit TsaD [Candidatus Kaiserbacteria bacterium]|nr:tRNA (adenosine(37)-N6)-threonylcarbamoyltransferase complex transferase subunit TsaD [Candidatus Kaiserbacteria bacterium]